VTARSAVDRLKVEVAALEKAIARTWPQPLALTIVNDPEDPALLERFRIHDLDQRVCVEIGPGEQS
jgi:hypothetical protein